MQTVIYARYSSHLQNSRSIADQIAACRERADREGWIIVATFHDAAISGAAGIDDVQRPGLNALLAVVEAGGIEQVLTESTDRMARHQGDSHTIRERLHFSGARLFTLMDGVVDDITGTIKGLFDARFRKDLGARIKRGQRGAVSDGRAPAGIAYGYRRANRFDERGEIIRGLREIDPDQAEIVVRIFTEYAAGRSPKAIASRLNDEGVPAPRGATWRMTTILGDRKRKNGMLKNRLYAGELVHERTSKVLNPRTRRTVIRPNDEGDWISHAMPDLRIVDEALWRAVADRLEASEGIPFQKQVRKKYLLSGLGRCGVCGGSWVKMNATQWACGRNRDGGGCSNGRSISTLQYEKRVLAGLQDQLLHPDVVTAYVRAWHLENAKRRGQTAASRTKLDRRIAESGRKIDRLVAAIADGADFTEIRDVLASARADRDAAKREAADIDALPVIALHPRLADDYRRQMLALADALTGHEEAQLEAIPRLRALIDRIELHPAPSGRGVTVTIVGRLAEIIGLATADARPIKRRRANT